MNNYGPDTRPLIYKKENLEQVLEKEEIINFAITKLKDSYEELKERAKNGDKFSQEFISIFVPYKNIDEPILLNLSKIFRRFESSARIIR